MDRRSSCGVVVASHGAPRPNECEALGRSWGASVTVGLWPTTRTEKRQKIQEQERAVQNKNGW